MKCDIGPKTLVRAVFVIFVVSTALSAHARQCSLANVAGTYGFAATGTLILPVGPVPLAAAGTITLHADGTVSGKEFRSVGGQFATETIGPGSWSVDSDCTGKLTAEVFVGTVLNRTSVLRFVVDDNLSELRVVQESLTFADGSTPPAVITFEGRRTFNNQGNNQGED
jgi:hypothetical protein